MTKKFEDHPPHPEMNRRDFLVRSAKAGIALAAAGALGYYLHDTVGPGAPVRKILGRPARFFRS